MSMALATAKTTAETRRSRASARDEPRHVRPRPSAPAGVLRRCACGGGCPRCRAKAASSTSYTSASHRSALPINEPGDAWERDADRMADAAMSGGASPSPSAQATSTPTLRRCACGGSCPSCRAKMEEDEHPPLMREATGGSSSPAVAPPIVHDVLSSPGRPLDAGTRGFMETRFGADFGGVRVHDGARAAESAAAVGAHAYAVGSDVVFGAGKYAPGTKTGDRLIAHELAHTLQPGPGARRTLRRRVVDDDAHLPCRATPGRTAADVTAIENEAATLAAGAAAALRAGTLAENTRALLWKRFGLDYNEPRVRCRLVAEIADRLANVAGEIRGTACTYNCAATGEPPNSGCEAGTNAYTYVGLSRRIDLCAGFWARTGPGQRAQTLLHEWMHYVLITRGMGDEADRAFDNAECYAAFACELANPANVVWYEALCPPRRTPPPPRDAARIGAACPDEHFASFPVVTGGLITGLPGLGPAGTLGGGLDVHFGITRMHDWEFTVGPRVTAAIPDAGPSRTAYLLGLRTAVQFRYRPWRFGFQVGGYAELGGASIPDAAGERRASPYAIGGLTTGLNLPINRQTAFQVFVDVGGGAGLNTRDNSVFGAFQLGLGIGLQLQ